MTDRVLKEIILFKGMVRGLSMTEYTIRSAVLEDISALAKLYVDSIHTHFKGTLPDPISSPPSS